MNKEYQCYPNKVIFHLNSKIYELSCIMKVAYNFIDDYYLFFDYENEDTIKVDFKSKGCRTSKEFENVIGEFYNELLCQSIRYKVSTETKNIRELILGRALYNTCIEDEKVYVNEPELVDDKEFDFNKIDLLNIGVNWFDNHDNGAK